MIRERRARCAGENWFSIIMQIRRACARVSCECVSHFFASALTGLNAAYAFRLAEHTCAQRAYICTHKYGKRVKNRVFAYPHLRMVFYRLVYRRHYFSAFCWIFPMSFGWSFEWVLYIHTHTHTHTHKHILARGQLRSSAGHTRAHDGCPWTRYVCTVKTVWRGSPFR